MHKKFSVIILFIFLLGIFLPQSNSMAANKTITISTDAVNVRSGPGLSYPLIKQAKRGETYPIVKEKGDWIEIELSFAKTGWVVNWLVTKNDAKTAKITSTNRNIAAIAKTSQLRVRSGPGSNFQIIGFLNKGQEVSILDQNENWYKISSPFGERWVSKEFLELKTAKLENSTASVSKNGEIGTVKSKILNVRKEPTASSKLVGKLAKGTKVTILSKENKWVKVKYLNIIGWVSGSYLDTQLRTTSETNNKMTTGIIGTVTAESLSVRAGSSTKSEIIGTVSKNQRFTIIEEKNNWAKIEYKTGSFGWVAGWYLEKSPAKTNENITNYQTATETSGQVQVAAKDIITILQDGTNIRELPSTQSDVVHRANKGDRFSVTGVKNDWYEIKLNNGKKAYVAGWLVSTSGSIPRIEKSGADGYIKNKIIVIDPGHGGGDGGTVGASGTLEKNLTLRTAKLLYDKLKAAGAKVYLTRNNDSYISLQSRVSKAHAYNADAFISLHYDSNEDRSVRGSTGFYYHSYQKALAQQLYSSMIRKTNLNSRGVAIGNYHVIRENKQKAVLIELGFISNPEEEMTVKSSRFQENAASGIYDGLTKYFKEN
ncbi:SH3 domain-containing protein [Neobacillus sp.]|uniref:SH3 domain-containing protein n=1 Tax=Neobacillus sp. TaxID=2675273 RepID=UPI0035B505C1